MKPIAAQTCALAQSPSPLNAVDAQPQQHALVVPSWRPQKRAPHQRRCLPHSCAESPQRGRELAEAALAQVQLVDSILVHSRAQCSSLDIQRSQSPVSVPVTVVTAQERVKPCPARGYASKVSLIQPWRYILAFLKWSTVLFFCLNIAWIGLGLAIGNGRKIAPFYIATAKNTYQGFHCGWFTPAPLDWTRCK